MGKRMVALLICLMVMSGLYASVQAASFSDVPKDKYPWAYDQIIEMANKGIINGYPDGTFMPDNGITRIEAMLLISRIQGINDVIYAPYLDEIGAFYADSLKSLNLQYEKEIAFLIYKGLFSVEEIASIASGNGLGNPLKRYEASEYLVRALGMYSELSDVTDTGYSDNGNIPAAYRKYVKYLKDIEIMQGMTATTFEPNFQVNRAQMAVMLFRVMNMEDMRILNAEFVSYTGDELKATVSGNSGSYDTRDTVFLRNNEVIAGSELKAGSDLILVFTHSTLKRVETFYSKPTASAVKTGSVIGATLSAEKHITITDSIDGTERKYKIVDDCAVYIDTRVATLSVIRLKDHVKLYLDKNDMVYEIEILDSTMEFTDGTIKKIDMNADLSIVITRKDGSEEAYSAADEVVVTRNGKEAILRDVLVGDMISSCTTKYSRITRLNVKSEMGNAAGVIREILLSQESSVVVEKNGEQTRYPINDNVEVYVDGVKEDLYSLRINMNATVSMDSGRVIRIDVSSPTQINNITGRVTVVNTAFGFVTVSLDLGDERQVFINSSTKITEDGTGRNKALKDIKVDDELVVIGKIVNGAYQATTIIITAQ